MLIAHVNDHDPVSTSQRSHDPLIALNRLYGRTPPLIGSIAIENARMHDHLKTDYDRLITDVHHGFNFGGKS